MYQQTFFKLLFFLKKKKKEKIYMTALDHLYRKLGEPTLAHFNIAIQTTANRKIEEATLAHLYISMSATAKKLREITCPFQHNSCLSLHFYIRNCKLKTSSDNSCLILHFCMCKWKIVWITLACLYISISATANIKLAQHTISISATANKK